MSKICLQTLNNCIYYWMISKRYILFTIICLLKLDQVIVLILHFLHKSGQSVIITTNILETNNEIIQF
jgi:hypothetical protein